MPQAIVTLNRLCPSRINPTLSSHAQLHGLFDFNATPFAPPGTKVIVHQKPTIRKSWALRDKDGWYIDQAKEHYRCYNIYVPETRAVIHPDTVEFLLHNSKMPFRSSTENANKAGTELIHALHNPAPAAPYAHTGDAQMQVLYQLAENFQRNTVQPQQQVPTEASKQLPVSPSRVAPNFPRVNIPPITAIPDRESITPSPPIQSENRVHTIPLDTPTPPRLEQRNRQQEAPNTLPLKSKIPPSSAPSSQQYPFRHQRQQLPNIYITWKQIQF